MLMRPHHPSKNGMIVEGDMTCELRAIRKNHTVSEPTIMCHMCGCHQQAIVTDRCYHSAALRSGMDGRELADGAVLSDGDARGLAGVLQILRTVAHA